MGDCFVPRSDISFGLLEKTFLDSYTSSMPGNMILPIFGGYRYPDKFFLRQT
jgi:hypothetical protein